jgi:hypothetical protein
MAETPRAPLGHTDKERSFVLSYFLMDDTLLIFEPPVRNSGISGGKYLERSRVYKPAPLEEEPYTYQVGAACQLLPLRGLVSMWCGLP